jgi:hypothetical protein
VTILPAKIWNSAEGRCYHLRPPNVRQALYMAAMRASNWNPRTAGKKPKVVIAAVMPKMITTLDTLVRDDVVWADRYIGRHRARQLERRLRAR